MHSNISITSRNKNVTKLNTKKEELSLSLYKIRRRGSGKYHIKIHSIIESEASQVALDYYDYSVVWMDEENKVKRTIKIDVIGTWAKGSPRMRWMDDIRHGINTAKGVLKEEDAQDGEEYTEPEKRDLAPSLDKHK